MKLIAKTRCSDQQFFKSSGAGAESNSSAPSVSLEALELSRDAHEPSLYWASYGCVAIFAFAKYTETLAYGRCANVALHPEHGQWYSGHVLADNGDGTFAIQYDDE